MERNGMQPVHICRWGHSYEIQEGMGCLLSKRSSDRDAEPVPSPKYSW